MKKALAVLMAAVFCMCSMVGCSQKKQVTIETAEDLNGLKVGVQGGTTGETWVKENCPDTEIASFKSGMDAALDLKNGGVDAVVIDELPASQIVAQNSDLKILDIRFTKEEYAIAIRKGDTELQSAINAAIADMKTSGEYDKLLAAFMPADGEVKIPDEYVSDGSETIKMGTNAAFWPFEYTEGNQIVGFDISMSQYVAQHMGKKLEVVNMDFDALIGAMQAGSIDFIAAGMSVTPERLENVDFSDPYYESEQVIIVRK
mgnify:CR=1 FL=1